MVGVKKHLLKYYHKILFPKTTKRLFQQQNNQLYKIHTVRHKNAIKLHNKLHITMNKGNFGLADLVTPRW